MISRQQIKVFIAALLTAPLAFAAASCGGSRAQSNAKANSNAPAAPQAVEVTTAPAISRNLPRFIEATGSLAADVQTDVAPTVGGRVASVNVDLGSFVQQGQVIVQLDDRQDGCVLVTNYKIGAHAVDAIEPALRVGTFLYTEDARQLNLSQDDALGMWASVAREGNKN